MITRIEYVEKEWRLHVEDKCRLTLYISLYYLTISVHLAPLIPNTHTANKFKSSTALLIMVRGTHRTHRTLPPPQTLMYFIGSLTVHCTSKSWLYVPSNQRRLLPNMACGKLPTRLPMDFFQQCHSFVSSVHRRKEMILYFKRNAFKPFPSWRRRIIWWSPGRQIELETQQEGTEQIVRPVLRKRIMSFSVCSETLQISSKCLGFLQLSVGVATKLIRNAGSILGNWR